MQVVIAPGRLKGGLSEAEMLAMSDRFQNEFVVHHAGVLRRVLVADQSGGYADIVFFVDESAIAEVMAAEEADDVCREFMSMWDPDEPRSYRVLRTYP